jgi:hypothetical protein
MSWGRQICLGSLWTHPHLLIFHYRYKYHTLSYTLQWFLFKDYKKNTSSWKTEPLIKFSNFIPVLPKRLYEQITRLVLILVSNIKCRMLQCYVTKMCLNIHFNLLIFLTKEMFYKLCFSVLRFLHMVERQLALWMTLYR